MEKKKIGNFLIFELLFFKFHVEKNCSFLKSKYLIKKVIFLFIILQIIVLKNKRFNRPKWQNLTFN